MQTNDPVQPAAEQPPTGAIIPAHLHEPAKQPEPEKPNLAIEKLTLEVEILKLDKLQKAREHRRWWTWLSVIALSVPLMALVASVIFNIINSNQELKEAALKAQSARLEADRAEFDLQQATTALAQLQVQATTVERHLEQAQSDLQAARDDADRFYAEAQKQRSELSRILADAEDMRSAILRLPDDDLKRTLLRQIIRLKGAGGVVFGRMQESVSFGEGIGRWRIGFNVRVSFAGSLPASQNIGSFSLQPFPGAKTFVALARWSDLATADTWDAYAIWSNAEGSVPQNAEAINTPGFTKLQSGKWYRWTWEFDLGSGQILSTSMTEVESGVVSAFEPSSRYLDGGLNSNRPAPDGYRAFVGGSKPGNRMEFEYIIIERLDSGLYFPEGLFLPPARDTQ